MSNFTAVAAEDKITELFDVQVKQQLITLKT